MGETPGKQESISENQRRINDRARTETIDRVGAIRDRTTERTRGSTARTTSYQSAVITDNNALEQGIRNRARAKHRRTFREVLQHLVTGLPKIIEQLINEISQLKKEQPKERESFKTVPTKEKGEYQQPEIKSVLDNDIEDPSLSGAAVWIKSIL